ncbi:MAG: Terminase-like family protein [Oscillibacter sp.]|nr:Terminase-like family protein [Oscillibacter sp.]
MSRERGARTAGRGRREVWSPQPRQEAFMRRFEDEALYGGAAGGGKSDALVCEALRQVHIPHYKALILRKTFPQLAELIDKTLNYYPRVFPRARYNDQKHVWRFPSGAKVIFGSMQYTKDRIKYQGQAYDFIGFDELTHFTYDEYSYLFSRNRPNGPGTRVYMRSTAHPGGIGHGWVKERFITAAKPMTTVWENVDIVFPDGHTERRRKSRIFVPSSVFDNPALLRNDPDYITRLASMPEAERKALLYGDWDTFSGQVFTEWRNDSERYTDRVNTHVISPFRVPDSWSIWCGLDWGYSRPFSVGWYAVDHERRLYRIREYYGCTGTPNQGVKMDPAEVAREIKRIEAEDPNLKGRRISRVGDPAIWGSDGTESIGALMERERVYFGKGDHARIDGKMQVHHRLAFDEGGVPMLYVFSTCKHFIRTVPSLVYSEKDVEDIDTDGEDHIYDELRYVCMENPIAPRLRKTPPPEMYDPLDLRMEQQYDRYDFYRRY